MYLEIYLISNSWIFILLYLIIGEYFLPQWKEIGSDCATGI